MKAYVSNDIHCFTLFFRIQEMFIQYNFILNLFTYIAYCLSWLR